MKVRLLLCQPYRDARVSETQCARRPAEHPKSHCGTCPVGAALAARRPLPETWPDGSPVRHADVTVLGTEIPGAAGTIQSRKARRSGASGASI